MNNTEKTILHALFTHLHHNTDRAVDFEAIKALNQKVAKDCGNLLSVGPGDDAAVIEAPGGLMLVAKMESHCSPCVVLPYESAHTCVDGTLRDIVAMGGLPFGLLNFVGTRPLKEKVLVGPCGFEGVCTCGNCKEMTSKERLDLIMKGIRDACENMGIFILGGGFSTSFSDIVPAVVGAAIGYLFTKKPLTKPAKRVGDKIILIGETSNDGNDTLYRAGMVSQMRPALPVGLNERWAMQGTLSALVYRSCSACSDLGAAGIAAAVCESARYGELGARVDLEKVPVRSGVTISPQEVLLCETQGRYVIQADRDLANELLPIIRGRGVKAEIIGEITGWDNQVFMWGRDVVADIPNNPTEEQIFNSCLLDI